MWSASRRQRPGGMGLQRLRDELGAALDGAPTALAAADRLCAACVELLDVDGASISLIAEGKTQGTFGSSGELSRMLDELQFTYGRGAVPGRGRAGPAGPRRRPRPAG